MVKRDKHSKVHEVEEKTMSKELQERAEIITRELQDALIPLQQELDNRRKNGRYS